VTFSAGDERFTRLSTTRSSARGADAGHVERNGGRNDRAEHQRTEWRGGAAIEQEER
jgi:hypothetical protein